MSFAGHSNTVPFKSPRCRRTIILSLAAIVSLAGDGSHAFAADAAKHPNILFILSDDQRWDTIHRLGNSEIQTPTLDKLVMNGFRFNNAYCMGSMVPAVCLPSRTMIMTGQSLWKATKNQNAKTAPPDVPLLPEQFNKAGYVTFHIGKGGNSPRYAHAAFATNIETKKTGPDDAKEHADRVIQFLASHDAKKPFFIYLAPSVPHDPRVAPPEFKKLYDASMLTLSKNFLPNHPFDNGELKVRDEMLAPFPRTEEIMKQHLADYYACISDLDHQVGRIMEALKKKGFADDTIIVYSSDHGLAVGGRHGLMGKQNLYEHVKPPLIFAGPGIPAGQSDALVYLFDLFPTLCDFAGIPTPDAVEGKSLRPIIEGKQTRVREVLLGAYRQFQRMVRDDRWKLIKYHIGGATTIQLFDLKEDPDEMRNLASDPNYADQLKRLERLMKETRAAFGDTVDLEKRAKQPD